MVRGMSKPALPLVVSVALGAALVAALTGCGSTPERRPVVPVETPLPALPTPPGTARVDVTESLHGVTLTDSYRWLENGKDPAVKTWVDAQDAFTRTLLDAVRGRAALEKRFADLFYVDSVSAPWHRGSRYFLSRRHKDKEKAIVYWREGESGDEKVLLDPNTWSADGSTALGDWNPTWDGKLVAYNVKEHNADEAVMHILDVASGKETGDVIPGTKYTTAAWMPDGKSFYYVFLPDGPGISVDERPGRAEIRMHVLGTDPAKDPLVFPATRSAETFIGVDVSRDGHWLFLTVQNGWNSTDVYFKDLRKPDPPVQYLQSTDPDARKRVAQNASSLSFTPLIVGIEAVTGVTAYKDRFYALTNDGAPRYRVFQIDPKKPARASWKEIIPEGAGTATGVIDSLQLAGGNVVLQLLENATGRLELRGLDGKLIRPIALPGIGTVTSLVGEPEDDTVYYGFASFTTPNQIYRASIKSGASSLFAKVEVPADTSQVEVEQVTYPSKDGTPISMFVVHKKGIAKDGSHPTLLYGYGGFNQNMTPSFASSAIVWLELGGVYAMPNLRGGGEYGEAWHRAGMLDKKQNVFDDFIAAGEYLIKEGWTTSERLAIRGGSNGGLLVGAVMTQRPDLFKAVICAVPLLDMVRYHLFGSGRTWIPEYGSAEDAEQFKTLYAYSPYQHVARGTRYPALLMMGADSDDRVDPMHARKFAAEVQWAVADVPDARPALFRVERNAGHGGGDMVNQAVESYADQWAFLAWQLGMTIDLPGGEP